jgi:hypothetical protein
VNLADVEAALPQCSHCTRDRIVSVIARRWRRVLCCTVVCRCRWVLIDCHGGSLSRSIVNAEERFGCPLFPDGKLFSATAADIGGQRGKSEVHAGVFEKPLTNGPNRLAFVESSADFWPKCPELTGLRIGFSRAPLREAATGVWNPSVGLCRQKATPHIPREWERRIGTLSDNYFFDPRHCGGLRQFAAVYGTREAMRQLAADHGDLRQLSAAWKALRPRKAGSGT